MKHQSLSVAHCDDNLAANHPISTLISIQLSVDPNEHFRPLKQKSIFGPKMEKSALPSKGEKH
jgi:hypothetical protein